jgi:hypothetical protein
MVVKTIKTISVPSTSNTENGLFKISAYTSSKQYNLWSLKFKKNYIESFNCLTKTIKIIAKIKSYKINKEL